MTPLRRVRAVSVLVVLSSLFVINCNTWARIAPPDTAVASLPLAAAAPTPGVSVLPTRQAEDPELAAALSEPVLNAPVVTPHMLSFSAGEPAGCLSAADQDALVDPAAMLAYADTLVNLQSPFSERLLPNTWNGYTGQFTWSEYGILSLDVSDVENTFLIQRMLNALQVSGFVTWLRDGVDQGLHILAIPLRDPALMQSDWSPYLRAYWLDRSALPGDDPSVLPALKLPPCAWMIARGFAPPVGMEWWEVDQTGWPDYASAAAAYLADSTAAAEQVALRINWLGDTFPEGPDTMCGPLAWSIMRDADAFPPGWGEWVEGPISFWLAQPEKNGRPWSLFPQETYHVYRFPEPLGSFDFRLFPLYPGDFLYTYAFKDGFEHMLMVTEVDAGGGVYTVSNLVKVEPQKQTTIERVLLLNLNDPRQGIARNQWAHDKINGRTGHAGFEVFRWAWMEKDISRQPVADTVLPGDTIGLLAARWKTPASLIAEYNGMAVDDPLTVGQIVMIPPNESIQAREE